MPDTDDSIRLKAVNHLTYNVKDKDRALKFWEEVLGVKRIPSQVDGEHILWLQLPSGSMVHLVENSDAPSTPSHHGAFEVDDIDASQSHIRSLGVETTEIAVRHDGQRNFFLEDTEGNRIEICTKSGFGVLV
jgi:catechol 2,3-dioxygenase-like lactoylglutathione lyase family enzyme